MTLSLPKIESWVPIAVAEAAVDLHAQFTKQNSDEALTALSRLISDSRMKAIWRTLYSKKRDHHRSTEVFVYPARTLEDQAAIYQKRAHDLLCEGNEILAQIIAKQAETTAAQAVVEKLETSEALRQDYAVKRIFTAACLCAADVSPFLASEIQQYAERVESVFAILRNQREVLFELGFLDEATALSKIVESCDDIADVNRESLERGDPRIITRQRTDPKLRTYALGLYGTVFSAFGRPLYTTLATTTNVVFERKVVTRHMVQQWILRTLPD